MYQLICFILLGFIFPNHSGLVALSKEFMVGKPLWVYVYISVLFLFSIIFAFVTMNGEEIADRMKKSGEYIYGIYPGEDTSRFIIGWSFVSQSSVVSLM